MVEALPPHMRLPLWCFAAFEDKLCIGLPRELADNCGSKPGAGLDLTTLCNEPRDEDFGICCRTGIPRPGLAARRNSLRDVSPRPKSKAIAEHEVDLLTDDLVFGVAGTASCLKDFA